MCYSNPPSAELSLLRPKMLRRTHNRKSAPNVRLPTRRCHRSNTISVSLDPTASFRSWGSSLIQGNPSRPGSLVITCFSPARCRPISTMRSHLCVKRLNRHQCSLAARLVSPHEYYLILSTELCSSGVGHHIPTMEFLGLWTRKSVFQ